MATTIFDGVLNLTQAIIMPMRHDLNQNLKATYASWGVDKSSDESSDNEILFEFALHESDQNYLNLFLIPNPLNGRNAPTTNAGGLDSSDEDLSQSDDDFGDRESMFLALERLQKAISLHEENKHGIVLGYKIGGIKLDTGEIYRREAPYGVDTYETQYVVSRFSIKTNSN